MEKYLNPGDIALIAVALFNFLAIFVGGFFAYLASRAAQQSLDASRINSAKLDAVHENVHTIEVATNSMKDELVSATADANFEKGRVAGVAATVQAVTETKK